MYIQPNSIVKVLRGVDIDPDYTNTLYFSSTSSQYTYFNGQVKYTYSALTYQRVNKNVIRVQQKADDLYDINYLMFQNTSYGNKWFYAFVTKVEYVNDITTNIYYEIDVIQSWLKDWSFQSCFVERMHEPIDSIGSNIVPEHIDTGEMVFNSYKSYYQLTAMAIILLVCDTDAVGGQLIDNCFSGARVLMYHNNQAGINILNQRLQSYSSKPDAIIGIYMCPAILLGVFQDDEEIAYSDEGYSNTWALSPIDDNTKVDEYTPRNKKLLTFPYNYLNVDNAGGQSISLRYEFFNDLTPQLKINACRTQPITITLEPHNYKGSERGSSSDDVHTLHTETLTLTGFPFCSWSMDSWKAWVAQNTIPLMADTSVGIAKMALTGGVSNPYRNVPPIEGAINSAGNLLSQIARLSVQADICRGNVNNGNVKIASDKQTFFYGRVSVNYQTASIIDSYFDKFGYAINRLIIPNIVSRPNWNYIKTAGCNIHGNIPADDHKKICTIIDNGITFWHNPSTMLDYSQNNAPT